MYASIISIQLKNGLLTGCDPLCISILIDISAAVDFRSKPIIILDPLPKSVTLSYTLFPLPSIPGPDSNVISLI